MSFKTSGIRWIWISLLAMILDQLVKFLVVTNMQMGQTINVLPFFNLTLMYNQGAAFSFLNQEPGWQGMLFAGIAIMVSIGIIVWLLRLSHQQRWLCVALCLLMGGALGNLCDRLILGYVVDYISLYAGQWHFAVFNVADVAVSAGAVMLLIDVLFWSKRA